MVPFAGYELPVQYSGVVEEHHAVRRRAGLFDVSHMGEFRVEGSGACSFLQRVTPNNVAKLAVGQAHYSALLNEDGTFLDDLLVYRLAEKRFMLVVNAAGRDGDFERLMGQLKEGGEDATLEDQSDATGLLALQGPKAAEILGSLTELALADIGYYRFAETAVAGIEMIVSRTGYTGEDGFELYVDQSRAVELWNALLGAGESLGLQPAGLGARDTLRLEAGMMLSGQDIGPATTPLEAGLSWIVKWKKGDFFGREALVAQRDGGPRERVVGFEVMERGIARAGHEVAEGDNTVGAVTSGSWSPTLEKAIGLAKVPASLAEVGTELCVRVRNRPLAIRVVELPFYRRST